MAPVKTVGEKMEKSKKVKKIISRLLIFILIAVVILTAVYFITAFYFNKDSDSKNSFFSGDAFKGKSVMVIVPHEDDEINTAGATINALSKCKCNIKVVYTTNGDKHVPFYTRSNEAKESLTTLGISPKNIIFLGYNDFNSLYNDKKNKGEFSFNKKHSETYGTNEFPDYHFKMYGKHAPYTRENLISDIQTVILNNKPDYIIAVDFDSHRDHREASLSFEEAMGNILKSEKGYHPIVFKAFAYNTAWRAKNDFYSLNLNSTSKPNKSKLNNKNYDTDIPQYTWKDRVRFPVDKDVYSHTIEKSVIYEALEKHLSQNAYSNAGKIINSDQVFWLRRTDSLTYDSQITVSSNTDSEKYLNDFKLVDCNNLAPAKTSFSNCVWSPLADDNDREVTVTFNSPQDISQVYLYDDYNLKNNILSGQLTFSDGSVINVNALNKDGAATIINFKEKLGITSFKFKILKSEGTPGLCEIEAYKNSFNPDLKIIKLKDNHSDKFMYDYYITKNTSSMNLGVYTFPNDLKYKISIVDGDKSDVKLKDHTLSFSKSFNYCLIKAQKYDDPSTYDEIKIQRLSPLKVGMFDYMQGADKVFFSADKKIKYVEGKFEMDKDKKNDNLKNV